MSMIDRDMPVLRSLSFGDNVFKSIAAFSVSSCVVCSW